MRVGDGGARQWQERDILPGPRFPAHALRALCASVIDTGSGKVNVLLLLKMGQRGREILLVYLPK